MRRFIDAIQAGATQSLLIQLALLFIGLAIVQQIFNVLADYWSERVAWTATNKLRIDLAAHLVRLDPSFHKVHTPGELIERVDGDVQTLARFFSGLAVELVGNLLLLIGVVVAVALVDIRLGVAFVVFVAVTIWLLGWVRQFGTPHWMADREQSATFYGYLGEVLTATEDLRANGAIPYAMQCFFAHLRRWWPIRLQASIWGQSVMNAAILAFGIGDAVAYGVSGWLHQIDAISLGSVYLVIAYVAMLAAPIETIRTQLQDLQRADASIIRIRELLATHSKLVDGSKIIPLGPIHVEFDAVCFAYEDHADGISPDQNGDDTQYRDEIEQKSIFDNLSFTVEPGCTLGLLGHTGSGKTTISRLLFRLYDPQRGAVRLNGIDLRDADIDTLRARIDLVTQDVQLFEASLRNNITFFDAAVDDEQILSVLDTLGLQPWLERLPNGLDTVISTSTLSAGEAQLLALARVFLKDPDLVILDEASSRLDPATETLLEQAIDKLLTDRTAVIIAHRLRTVDRANNILILEDGQIAESGQRSQLAANPASRFAQLRQTGFSENFECVPQSV